MLVPAPVPVRVTVNVGPPDVTVKSVALVAVPPSVVTVILPVVAAEGTVAVICVRAS